MSKTVAYELREEFSGTVHQLEHEDAEPVEVPIFTGGQIAYGAEGESFDVGAELEAGGGTIVIPEHELSLIDRLDAYPALKRAGSSDADPSPTVAPESRNRDDLARELEVAGVVGAGSRRKDDLVTAVRELERRSDAGENVAPDTHIDELLTPPAGDEGGEES